MWNFQYFQWSHATFNLPWSLLSYYFCFLLSLVFFILFLGLRMLFRYHSPPISVKSVRIVFMKSSGVGFGISVGIFKYFLHLILIGTTTPWIVSQDIDPSVYEVNTDIMRNKRNFIRIIWYGSSTTKVCCIIWLIIFFVVGI